MSLDDILRTDTGRKPRLRVGRGLGSGSGKTCNRGSKGAGARAGSKKRGPKFEGGQFPFWQRLPRRGFSNFNHTTRYLPVDLGRALKRVEGDLIDFDQLAEVGLVGGTVRVKLVNGTGGCDRKVTVRVHKVTASVRQAVEQAGGSIEELDG